MGNNIRHGVAVIAGLAALTAGVTLAPRLAAGTPGSAPAALPQQVQVKFEWVASANSPGGTPDKSLETLVLMAQEGRTAKVSSQHLQNGTGVAETVSVLPHMEPGGFASLDLAERIDNKTQGGETTSNSAQTTVRIKTGQTGLVRGLITKQDGQGAERMLFVTPTVVRTAS